MYDNITGIILSGGYSSRMGEDKALLKAGNQTIIERISILLKSLFSNVIIITNTLSDYKFLNVPLYEDIYKHKGPLSGIHSGLVNSKTESNFIISCDTPLITKQLVKYIVDFSSNKPVRYCADSHHQHPLVGLYSRKLLQEIEKVFKSTDYSFSSKEKKYSLRNFLKNVDAEIIQIEQLPFYSNKILFNVNSPTDLLKLNEYLNIDQ
jgi:molybdopterin-guanine dinucleotide biosynthesis protein A